ncbi:hypothetical protein TNCV_1127101 [Trichonephila clavipes]|nr:hypothetical protein TNCV_1127101 [Trichonephila clavipes]
MIAEKPDLNDSMTSMEISLNDFMRYAQKENDYLFRIVTGLSGQSFIPTDFGCLDEERIISPTRGVSQVVGTLLGSTLDTKINLRQRMTRRHLYNNNLHLLT